jgi:hypothetical protein
VGILSLKAGEIAQVRRRTVLQRPHPGADVAAGRAFGRLAEGRQGECAGQVPQPVGAPLNEAFAAQAAEMHLPKMVNAPADGLVGRRRETDWGSRKGARVGHSETSLQAPT